MATTSSDQNRQDGPRCRTSRWAALQAVGRGIALRPRRRGRKSPRRCGATGLGRDGEHPARLRSASELRPLASSDLVPKLLRAIHRLGNGAQRVARAHHKAAGALVVVRPGLMAW